MRLIHFLEYIVKNHEITMFAYFLYSKLQSKDACWRSYNRYLALYNTRIMIFTDGFLVAHSYIYKPI